MKYLVLFAVLAVFYVLWKQQRMARPGTGGREAAPPPAGQPHAMVRCAACSLHLPRAEAVTDAQGRHFCSPEHREEHQGSARR